VIVILLVPALVLPHSLGDQYSINDSRLVYEETLLMAKLINLNLGWMTIGKKPWLHTTLPQIWPFAPKQRVLTFSLPRPMGSGNKNLVVPSDFSTPMIRRDRAP
jgi:hypothetical protein